MERLEGHVIFITDGDNTLWDTNEVFTDAQVAMLDAIRIARPSTGTSQLSFELLRRVDSALIAIVSRHEYDFELLALALILCQEGTAEGEATRKALSPIEYEVPREDVQLAKGLTLDFHRRLSSVPPLLRSVREGLNELVKLKTRHAGRLAVILYSEGRPDRVNAILRHHFAAQKDQIFDLIEIVDSKDVETLRNVTERGLANLRGQGSRSDVRFQVVVVGDSLKREITLGNQIGAITAYVPGGYKGTEVPTNESEQPDRVVQQYRDAVTLARDLLSR